MKSIALRSAGGNWLALIACASLFALHPPPIRSIGLICFATGVALFERARARAAVVQTLLHPVDRMTICDSRTAPRRRR
jgi:hypothetical protein